LHFGNQRHPLMNEMTHRVTPLTVLTDIGLALARYRGPGFDVVYAGCVGLRAGGTYLILATTDHLITRMGAGDFP